VIGRCEPKGGPLCLPRGAFDSQRQTNREGDANTPVPSCFKKVLHCCRSPPCPRYNRTCTFVRLHVASSLGDAVLRVSSDLDHTHHQGRGDERSGNVALVFAGRRPTCRHQSPAVAQRHQAKVSLYQPSAELLSLLRTCHVRCREHRPSDLEVNTRWCQTGMAPLSCQSMSLATKFCRKAALVSLAFACKVDHEPGRGSTVSQKPCRHDSIAGTAVYKAANSAESTASAAVLCAVQWHMLTCAAEHMIVTGSQKTS